MAAVVAFDGPAAAAGAAAAAGGAAACTAAAGAGAAGGAGLGAVAGSAADSVSPAAAPIACADASCWRANSSREGNAKSFSKSTWHRQHPVNSETAGFAETRRRALRAQQLVGVARGYGGSAKSLNDTGADHAGGLGPRCEV